MCVWWLSAYQRKKRFLLILWYERVCNEILPWFSLCVSVYVCVKFTGNSGNHKKCVTHVWFLRLAASKSPLCSVKYMNGSIFFSYFVHNFSAIVFFHNGTWIKQKRLSRDFFMHAQVCSSVHSVVCVCDMYMVQSIAVEWINYDEQITISMHDIKRQLVFVIVYIALCADRVVMALFFSMCLMLLMRFYSL